MLGRPEMDNVTTEGAPGRPQGAEVPASDGPGPRLVHRDGMAYVEGCDAPVWQLEMAHRAGSPADALLTIFRGLTSEGLELAFAYAQQHDEEIEALIQELGPANIPACDGKDDEDEFRADLDELFERDAELFRRLAQ